MKSIETLLKFTFMVCLLKVVYGFGLFKFQHHSTLIPHPEKAHRGGEDAYFASEKLMIVADGVGGWNNYGIDPSEFSRYLCKKGAQIFSSNQQHYSQNLIQIIAESARSNQNLGSSTMAVVSIHNQFLKTCYIGDSGFVIFRLNQQKVSYQLVHQFKQQQHSFNFPFQLAKENQGGDNPYLSICQDFTLQQNDVIIVGSDGLFDNVFVHQMLHFINENLDQGPHFYHISDKLAKLAIERGNNSKFESPFQQRALQQGLVYYGGKLDDTTVIVSLVKKNQKQINQQEPIRKGKQIEKQINSSLNDQM